jgi:hypothetical protein
MHGLWIKLTIVLLVVCGGRAAVAQTADGVITIQQGKDQALAFNNVRGASVENVNVIYLKDIKPNTIVIFGIGVGETSLEVVHRSGQRKKLTVRVLSAQALTVQAVAQTTPRDQTTRDSVLQDGTIKTFSSQRDEDANPAITEGATVAAAARTPVAQPGPSALKAAVSTAAAPTARREIPGARRSFWSRLEISVETAHLIDREDVRMISDELMDPKKLQEAISADSSERLATNSQREQTMTVSRSSSVTSVSIVDEIDARNSLTLNIPYVRRRDEITVGGNAIKTRGQGLGDIQMRFERLYPHLRKSAWDGSVEFDVGLPTGKSIYSAGGNQSPLGIGHYEIGSILGVRRIFDPLIFNGALGINYALPRTVQETRITPGLGYSAQTGVGFALSDRWVFSEQMYYTRRPNVLLSTPTDAQTESTAQSSLSHSVIYRPSGGNTIGITFNLGLNSASSDYGFVIKYTHRSKDQTSP